MKNLQIFRSGFKIGKLRKLKKLRYPLITLLVIIVAGFFWWQISASAVDLTNKTTKIFVIPRGEGASSVAGRLKKEGLIRSSLAFQVLVVKDGLVGKVQAGDFRLSPSMSLSKIVELLQHGSLDVWVTIPEGWRNEEIAQELSDKLKINPQDFLELAEEGYMFPDTYLFTKEATAATVAGKMRDTFDLRFDSSLKQEAQKRKLTLDQVVILASLVEREVKNDADRPIVAGILLKRLKEGMALQIDATVQYVIGSAKCKVQSAKCEWWPKNLTKDDLKLNSPYNTYLNPGFPPAPISNPGLAAIKAVIYPKETDHWFYISDRQGQMHYAETLNKHNQNIERYLK